MTPDIHNAQSVALGTRTSDTSAPGLLAPSFAPVQYSWSIDEEVYRDKCGSIDEAIAAALDHHDGLQPGIAISIGEVIPVDAVQLVDVDNVIEGMFAQALELFGEPSRGYLAGATMEQKSELRAIIASWADRVETPTFWRIGTIYTHMVSATDLDQTRETEQTDTAQGAFS